MIADLIFLRIKIAVSGLDGIEPVKIIAEKYPEVKALMQTIFEDNDKIFQPILPVHLVIF